ncbi:hypothetical protein [Chamaesiphon sp. VAR_48_metabat_403]|uniref:hypothetical protein n=1 Tax=Chamaesiphon sp. VAR_48_metabat_403 TaxID=2964700 RepID=UPI00286E2183|nr:hypothetical protein [Chamaesiphon sp. VAR_48_metabat_403]
MKKLISSMLFAAIVLVPFTAEAGPIQNRINRQESRTYQGVKNGSISTKEYKRIDRRIDSIEAARLRQIKSGGKLTNAEKYRLNRRLNNTSRTIYRDRHD